MNEVLIKKKATNIKIENFWLSQNELCIGLSVQCNTKFPIVVKRGLQNYRSAIVDILIRHI